MPNRQKKQPSSAARVLVAQFIENEGADSVVVLWSQSAKVGSIAQMVSWGNQFAVRDMIRSANDDYTISRINQINKTVTKPKDPS